MATVENLPENWTVKDLLRKHPSRPYNPLIANAFFRAGLIEAWGRGIDMVLRACAEFGARKPIFDYQDTGLMVEFFGRPPKKSSVVVSPKMSPKMSPKIDEQILKFIERDPRISAPHRDT